jgi:hypothetical protein
MVEGTRPDKEGVKNTSIFVILRGNDPTASGWIASGRVSLEHYPTVEREVGYTGKNPVGESCCSCMWWSSSNNTHGRNVR